MSDICRCPAPRLRTSENGQRWCVNCGLWHDPKHGSVDHDAAMETVCRLVAEDPQIRRRTR